MKKRSCLFLLFLILMAFTTPAQVKFQLEFAGGYGLIKPEDFNLVNNFLEGFLADYETLLHQQETAGLISNLQLQREGEFKTLKGLYDFNGRLKVVFAGVIGLSIGVDYITRTVSGDPELKATFHDTALGVDTSANFEFPKQELKISAFIPNAAIHLIFPVRPVGFEIWGGAGYVNAAFESNQEMTGHSENSSYSEDLSVKITAKGEAKGLSYSAGGRINLMITKNMGMFLGGDYLYAKLKDVKGEGSYEDHYSSSTGSSWSNSRSWQDEDWYIAEIFLLIPSTKHEFSTSDPKFLGDKIRNFELNLSGFRFAAGLILVF